MKKSLSHTRVSVKLRKAEFRKEWYLYIESYPVISKNGDKPQRVREYVNRTITTPIWDKSRTARTASDGSVTYKPKRDVNGVILCKSELDQESCIYSDKVSAIRQKELKTFCSTVTYTTEFMTIWTCIPFMRMVSSRWHSDCMNRNDAIQGSLHQSTGNWNTLSY